MLPVLDTSCVLHQIDFLESAGSSGAFTNVVIPQTVMNEIRGLNISVYNRMHTLLQVCWSSHTLPRATVPRPTRCAGRWCGVLRVCERAPPRDLPAAVTRQRSQVPHARLPNPHPLTPPPISDAAVERLVRWLTHHWAGAPACVLITNSAAAASAAAARGLNSTTIHALVKQASAGTNSLFRNPISVIYITTL